MKLYTFFQSGSAYRARIALALKGIEYEPVYVVIKRGEGDLHEPEYLKLNPSAVVPTLIDGEHVLNQTIPIMEYLEEKHPTPALLPKDAAGRARVRAISQLMVSDTHPMGTGRVIGYLEDTLALNKEAMAAWMGFWNRRGFGALEKMLTDGTTPGQYCHGNDPTMADVCLVAQYFVVEKFNVDLSDCPQVRRVYENCMKLPAFSDTHPSKQPDNPANK